LYICITNLNDDGFNILWFSKQIDENMHEDNNGWNSHNEHQKSSNIKNEEPNENAEMQDETNEESKS